jgi:Domain of unknown function (DUF6471)
VEGNDTVWSSLATRAIRVLMARKEVSYARLAGELTRLGQEESARSAEGKVKRGSFQFSFFLQSLVAVGADCPHHWTDVLSASDDWDRRASRLLLKELNARPWLTWLELSRRLETIGERISPNTLSTQIEEGNFPATLFLQCAVVCAFDGLELFIDRSDLRDAARRRMNPPDGVATPSS